MTVASPERVAIVVWRLSWSILRYSVPVRSWPVPAMCSTTDCRCPEDKWLLRADMVIVLCHAAS